MRTVSPSFAFEAAQKNAKWLRRFYIGGSDYSAFVMGWPSISRQWDGLAPVTVSLNLANVDGTFNFFMTDKVKLHTSCALQLGLAAPVTAEYLTLFSGTVDAIRYNKAGASITLIDKLRKLADRTIGSTTTPTSYGTTFIHDLAWYICTSHGGLSAIASTSNPDIDYGSFRSWTSVFSLDNVRARANFTGIKALDALKKLGILTRSGIWVENDKIKFNRFGIDDVSSFTIDGSVLTDLEHTLDDRTLVNRFSVGADYRASSGSFAITVTETNQGSVGSYGLREDNINETAIWLVDSVSALGLAQRMTITNAEIYGSFALKMPLRDIASTIGDGVTLVDSHLNINDTYRQLSENINMETGSKTIRIDKAMFFKGFRVNCSYLDGQHVLA